jgi:hypothetical protein
MYICRTAEVTPPTRVQAVEDCISDLPPQDCPETAFPEARDTLSPNEDLPASPADVTSQPPSTGRLQRF